ncbi:hypothetical protein IWQ61_000481 [Dispira simplex]|nr:hypothetical protein IWQ61_000481 [Dispira simplex]
MTGNDQAPKPSRRRSSVSKKLPVRERFEQLTAEGVPSSDIPVSSMTEEERVLAASSQGKRGLNEAKAGRLPSTEIMTEGLNRVRLSDNAQGLSAEGQKLAEDVDRLAQSTQQVLQEKNRHGELQQAVYHGVRAGGNVTGSDRMGQVHAAVGESAPAAKELTRDLRKRVNHVSRLLVTSPPFRQLLADMMGLFQDVIRNNDRPNAQGVSGGVGGPERKEQSSVPQSADSNRMRVGSVSSSGAGNSDGGGHFPNEPAATESRTAEDRTSRLTGVNLTPEQKNQFIHRFKQLLREMQTDESYRTAIEDVFVLLSELRNHLGRISDVATEQTRSHSQEDQDLQLTTRNARQLVENFANGYSTKPLYQALRDLINIMRSDVRIQELMHDTKLFVIRALRDPEYVNSRLFSDEANQLLDGHHAIFDIYAQHASDTVGREINTLQRGFREDPTTSQWTGDLQKLLHDMFCDAKGRPTVKTDLIRDAIQVLPRLARAARYLPLPRIEHADEQFEYAVDNIVLSLSHIVPSDITLATRTNVDFGDYGKSLGDTIETKAHRARQRASASQTSGGISSASTTEEEEDVGMGDTSHVVAFDIHNVVCIARNASFYYMKKAGFPKMADSGLADLEMNESKGLDLHVVVRVLPGETKTTRNAVQVVKIDTRLRSIKLKLHSTGHDLLYKMFSPVINTTMRKRIQSELRRHLHSFVEDINVRITQRTQQKQVERASTGSGHGEELPSQRQPSGVGTQVPKTVPKSTQRQQPQMEMEHNRAQPTGTTSTSGKIPQQVVNAQDFAMNEQVMAQPQPNVGGHH